MNRPPQPADSWWPTHKASCSGQFIKVDEPKTGKTKTGKTEESSVKMPTKAVSFFPAPKIYCCVSCEKFRTPQLDELNAHLDQCLSSKTPSRKESEKESCCHIDEKGRLVYDLD